MRDPFLRERDVEELIVIVGRHVVYLFFVCDSVRIWGRLQDESKETRRFVVEERWSQSDIHARVVGTRRWAEVGCMQLAQRTPT
jgi:hypothetical protein